MKTKLSQTLYFYPFSFKPINFNYYYDQREVIHFLHYNSSKKKKMIHSLRQKKLIKKRSPTIEKAFREYLQKKKEINLPFTITLGTVFQKKVWNALTKIPYGKTSNYSKIAQQINHSQACRAVGSAIGKNPLSIIIPCHRVLHKNQNKVGKYNGGEKIKKKLLELEGSIF